jgi:AcrR family transcriptional regulator
VVIKQRARSLDDKQARRDAILEVALGLFLERGHTGLTMADVAARAGLAKGTLYLYVRTREELLLALLERLLERWFQDLDARLDAAGPLDARGAAALVAATLGDHDPLTRLLAILESVLEHNVPLEAARAYKRTMLARAAGTAARLDRAVGGLGPDGAFRALVYVHALVVGLRQAADPAPVVAEALRDPELAPLRVDFLPEIERALASLFLGLTLA